MTYFTDVEAVLFDMDGTLIKHTWQLSQITEALFAKFSQSLAPLSCQEFYDVFWLKNADLWYMMVDGVIDGETAQLYSYINTLRTLKKDPSPAPDMVAYWMELVLQEAIPFDDTYTVLQQVGAHFTTGIITNGFTALQQAKLKKYQLDAAVDFCLISEAVGFHKPDIRLFKEALQRLGNVPPEHVVFVGDTLTADIEGALNAGFQAVFMNEQVALPPTLKVPKIKQLSDLLPLLPLP